MKFNTRSFGTMGVMGLAAGATVSLAAAPSRAQTGAKATSPTTVTATTSLHDGSSIGASGEWSFKTGDHDIRIQTKDGTVVHAEQNGKEIPADRIKFDGGRVTVVDEKGATVFEFTPPTPPTSATLSSLLAARAGNRLGTTRAFSPMWSAQTLGPGAGNGSWILGSGEPAQTTPPKVMMGVTMAEPEYGLRKHCGLDQRPGTMVNEVYKGLPASKAGIEPFDVIVEIDGKSPATPDVVRGVLQAKGVGDTIQLRVLHKCEPKGVTVTLEAYDAEKLEQARMEQMKAAGVEAPTFDEEAVDTGGDLRSLIARVQPGQNGTMWLNPGMDNHDLQERIAEAVKRLSGEAQQSEAARRDTNNEKVRMVEQRLDRLEKLLEKLVEQREAAPAVPPKSTPSPAKGGD